LTLPPEAAAYISRLEREPADLPPDERADLLEEVEASLLEGEQELGDPARFAAELRASAGLPAAAPAVRPSAAGRCRSVACGSPPTCC
jgi:uncharacterized membrane protein